MQYYGNDAVVGNSTVNAADNVGYQQYQSETALQPPPKQDEYYTVSPGENYYNDYVDENQTYSTNTNIGNSSEVSTFSTAAVEQQQQIHQTQPEIDYTVNHEQTINTPAPNYLQSDTDDSQTGYPNVAINQAPQSQESDFDFSTNS